MESQLETCLAVTAEWFKARVPPEPKPPPPPTKESPEKVVPTEWEPLRRHLVDKMKSEREAEKVSQGFSGGLKWPFLHLCQKIAYVVSL
jgi:hypothetical protein